MLAAEAMVDALFNALGSAPGVDLIKLVEICYEFSDDQLLWSTAQTILSAAGVIEPSEQLVKFVDDLVGSSEIECSSFLRWQSVQIIPQIHGPPTRLNLVA